MAYDVDNNGPRETHLEADGNVTVGGFLDQFGTEMASEQGHYREEPEQYDDGGYEPAIEYDDNYVSDVIGGVVRESFDGLGYNDVYGGLYSPEPSSEERILGSVITPEQTEAVEELIAERPEVYSSAAREAMAPTLRAIADEYGVGRAFDPEVIEAVYEEVGGDERFARAAYEEREVSGLLGEPRGQDAFT